MRHCRLDKLKVKDSKMRPLWLEFTNFDPHGAPIKFMHKKGDGTRYTRTNVIDNHVLDLDIIMHVHYWLRRKEDRFDVWLYVLKTPLLKRFRDWHLRL